MQRYREELKQKQNGPRSPERAEVIARHFIEEQNKGKNFMFPNSKRQKHSIGPEKFIRGELPQTGFENFEK